MKKSKLVATFVAVLLIVSLCALCLYGCNDEGVGIEGKGVSRPEDIFTNDLDTTDSENLIANAHVTASSAADSVGNLSDGNTDTVWTATSVSGEYVDITFSAPTEINTVVLRENGNYVTGFRFLREENGEWVEFYRQDRMERYRYCTFTAETVSTLRIAFDGANSGRNISLSEIEVYNVAPKSIKNGFRVFSYYNSGDFLSPALDDEQLAAQLDVVTDIIMFLFVYWDSNGNLVYQEDPENPGPTNLPFSYAL